MWAWLPLIKHNAISSEVAILTLKRVFLVGKHFLKVPSVEVMEAKTTGLITQQVQSAERRERKATVYINHANIHVICIHGTFSYTWYHWSHFTLVIMVWCITWPPFQKAQLSRSRCSKTAVFRARACLANSLINLACHCLSLLYCMYTYNL